MKLLIMILITLLLFISNSIEFNKDHIDNYRIYKLQYTRMTKDVFDLVTIAETRYVLHRAIILAFIDAESEFIRKATSSSGAKGFMQIMPFHIHGNKKLLTVPIINIMMGSMILKGYIIRAKGNIFLSAKNYNSGPHSSFFNGYYIVKITNNINKSVPGYPIVMDTNTIHQSIR